LKGISRRIYSLLSSLPASHSAIAGSLGPRIMTHAWLSPWQRSFAPDAKSKSISRPSLLPVADGGDASVQQVTHSTMSSKKSASHADGEEKQFLRLSARK
jgi:hypothetical protein